VALVSALVGGQHGLAPARDVVGSRDRFGKCSDRNKIAAGKLIELHRSRQIAAHKEALGGLPIRAEIGQQRRARTQQPAHVGH